MRVGEALGWTLLAHALAGLVPALTQLALTEVDPYTLVAGRQTAALLALLALGRARGLRIEEQRPLGAAEWLLLCAAAWLGVAAPALWLTHGVALAGAGHAAALLPLTPLVALALAQGMRVARRSGRGAALALLAGGAIALLLIALSSGSARGDLWLALGCAGAGSYALAAGPLVERHGAARVQLWALALALPPLLLCAAAVAPTRPLPGAAGLAWLALLGAAASAAWVASGRSAPLAAQIGWAGAQAGVGLIAAALLGDASPRGAAVAAALVAAGLSWSWLRGSSVDGVGGRCAALPTAAAAALLPASFGAARALPAGRLRTRHDSSEEAAGELARAARPQFARLHDVVQAAREQLPAALWQALIGGAETETTLARNRRALDALALRPRALRDVSQVDASVSALHSRLRIPVVLAPLAGLESLDPAGALACARAAHAFGTAFIQSSLALPQIEISTQLGPAPRVLQIAVRGDSGWLDAQVERALASGCAAVCLSTECAAPGRLEREAPPQPWHARDPAAAALSWKYVEHYKQRFELPLLLKGIATAQDAQRACLLGVDVIYVSNHGGRQLDHGRGAVAVLPEVVDAVAERAPVWVDGGFCRGTDVVKALALGAQVVGVGRLIAYGLAAAGEHGVLRVLELLEEEICSALAQLGAARPAELDRSWVERCEALGDAHALSAFPLLER